VKAEGVATTGLGAQRVRELLPRRVFDATAMRLTQLTPDARALARAVAVLGGRGELRIAAALANLDAEAGAAAADALSAAGLMRDGLTFAHPLLRSAVYAGIGSAERAHMHAAAARVLSAAPKAEAVVAAQLLAAEPVADPWVVEALRRAACGALAEGAPASAGRYLRRALEEPPTAELRPDVLAELASAEIAAGDARGAEDLRAALEVIDDPARRVGLRITLANSFHHHGRHLEAAAVLDEGIAELDGRGGALELELETAFIGVARLEPSLRVRAMPRLAELSRGMRGATAIERLLLAHEANRRAFAGEPHTEVRDLVRRAWADGALLDDQDGGGLAPITALAALGWCDDFDAYEENLHAMQANAQRRGLVLRHADATYGLHLAHHFRGRLADAIADAENALDARRYGWRAHLATASSQLAWTLIELDELDRAERTLADPDIEIVRGKLPYALVHDARGRLAIARADTRRALEEFLAAGQIAETAPLANPSYLPWRSSAALAASRLGDHELARDLIAEELRRAERFGAPRPRGVALRAAGLIEGGDNGIEVLRAAVERLEASPAGLEHARALTDLGAALRRRGQRRDARTPLRTGLELAISFGAKAIERRARDELVAAGARPRRRQFSGVDALTPGERRVAGMAAGGMSNREIAESLFVTVKAVQWHLGNTYRKVGVSSRQDLSKILGSA
jgi:DNA-binding CsgD family transcriptional regulator